MTPFSTIPLSPSNSDSSFELLSPHPELSLLEEENDIVLSPIRKTSYRLDDDDVSLALDEQDFVLVLPGASLLSPEIGSSSSRRNSFLTLENETEEITLLHPSLSYRAGDPPFVESNSPSPRSMTPIQASEIVNRSVSPTTRPHFSLSEKLATLSIIHPDPLSDLSQPHPRLTKSQKQSRRRARAKISAAEKGVLSGVVVIEESSRRDQASRVIDENAELMYENAVQHMNRFLASPPDRMTTESRLAVCQALLVELGVTPTPDSVPHTHRAATTMLASSVFINILDYLALRNKGRDALRAVMHPSKRALKADVRKRRASLKTVKASGLRSLLVHL